VLVVSTASTMNDSYCSLAWGARLAELTDDVTAAQVLSGESAPGLSERETALADWARCVVGDPNGISSSDVARLRNAGFADREIFEATAFIAFRHAFSTINDALGAAPDHQLAEEAPALGSLCRPLRPATPPSRGAG
jgi:alkylhydroperoxidase family enzyme